MNTQTLIKPLRCAVYTRKSSEEGLDQAFNSLDAQREACEAYIKSQQHEGWTLIETAYDDGGFSGGNIERPALKSLLTDLKSGLIDIVVVYKVDRLSRSLSDFSNMVDTFSKFDVSFVSITQQFNTSTSMGRLTLNVLLSFAQFEREVTGERIRDKIAASKKKGMWMGGVIPLGYDIDNRMLIVNESEAKIVEMIYQSYIELKCVRKLKEKIDNQGIVSKWRKNGSGEQPLSRGALYSLLKNRIYNGQITHKDKHYEGQHEAIIETSLWNQVQKQLIDNKHNNYHRTTSKSPSLLSGLLVDNSNNPMTPSHATKGSRRYRYYVNQTALQFKKASSDAVLRIPAQTIESLVENELSSLLSDQHQLTTIVENMPLSAFDKEQLFNQLLQVKEKWYSSTTQAKIPDFKIIIKKIVLTTTKLEIQLIPLGLLELISSNVDSVRDDESEIYIINLPVQLKRCGVETKLIVENKVSTQSLRPHSTSANAIQRALQKALQWNQTLISGRVSSMKEVARQENVSQRYIASIIRLAFLSPSIMEKIANGNIPHDMTLARLKKNIPHDWSEQELLFK